MPRVKLQALAVMALANLAYNSADNQRQIGHLGLSPVVALLRARRGVATEQAALLVANLSGDSSDEGHRAYRQRDLNLRGRNHVILSRTP